MWKQFSLKGNYKWINILEDIVDKYNNTVFTTIGMKPKDVWEKDEKLLLKTVYSHLKIIDPKTPKYQLNDFVRISKYREIFSKGYTPNWSNEIFQIVKIVKTYPTTYKLEDYEGNQIRRNFYTEEFQKVKHPDILLFDPFL